MKPHVRHVCCPAVQLSPRTRINFTLVVISAVASVSAQQAPRNLDFEQGELGKCPPGWTLSAQGSRAELTPRDESASENCVRLALAESNRSLAAGLRQVVDARPFQGKYVRLSADVKNTGGRRSRAQLWMRVDRPGGKRGFHDTMHDRPIRSIAWQRYEIIGKVADDALTIDIGLMLIGGGVAWLDAVRLEVVEGVVGEVSEAPRALEGEALHNIVAFTKLYGYVRYFHPSSEARATDWDEFVLAGVRRVELAKTPGQLVGLLRGLFAKVAPTVRITVGEPLSTNSVALAEPASARGVSVVTWRHAGVGLNEKSVYSSALVEESVAARREAGSSRLRPDQPIQLELTRGLMCSVPLALYKSAGRTLPRTQGREVSDPASPLPPSAEDRGTRISAVISGWNVFQHFYPYFDVIDTDWDKALSIALQRAATDSSPVEFLVTLREMVAKLQDGHIRVHHLLDPKDGKLPLAFVWAENSLVIDRVSPVGMAAGAKRGDVITAIDGISIGDLARVATRRISAATPQFMRVRLQHELARGQSGKEVTLSLFRRGESLRVPLIYSRETSPPEARPDKITELRPGVFYIDIQRVTDEDLRTVLEQLQGAKGIVFDFRGYPNRVTPGMLLGHLIDEPVQSAQWIIPHPSLPDHVDLELKPSTGRWLIRPRQPHLAAKKVFITDGRAISYAESCLGIIEHYELGEIVGEASAGTNGSVNTLNLMGGYRITWTGMQVLKHDGTRHHGVGISPTIPVSRTIAGIRAARDELLEIALSQFE